MLLLIILNFLAAILNFLIWAKTGSDLNLLFFGVLLGVTVMLVVMNE